jgi:hypothetical protein
MQNNTRGKGKIDLGRIIYQRGSPSRGWPRLKVSVAINHRTQLPLVLFISRLGFAPRLRASGFAPPPPPHRQSESRDADGRAPRDVGTVFRRDLRRVGQTHDTLEV